LTTIQQSFLLLHALCGGLEAELESGDFQNVSEIVRDALSWH